MFLLLVFILPFSCSSPVGLSLLSPSLWPRGIYVHKRSCWKFTSEVNLPFEGIYQCEFPGFHKGTCWVSSKGMYPPCCPFGKHKTSWTLPSILPSLPSNNWTTCVLFIFFPFCCKLMALFIAMEFNSRIKSFHHSQSGDPIVCHMISYSLTVFNF